MLTFFQKNIIMYLKGGENMTIGERIRLRREELNITQEELATTLGYKSRSSINKIELGGNGLTQRKIVDFAKALYTTPSYIMGWEDEPTADNALPTLPTDEQELLSNYRQLNEDGQERLLETSEELTEMAKYKKDDTLSGLA